MHRLIVAFLAAFDAAVAAAVGIAVVLAPATLIWVLAFGGGADWGALWTTSGTVWQLGHVVPLWVTLPGDYLASAGIALAAESFTLSLAPLAFAAFTVIFAARSGARSAQADAWITGVVAGTAVFTLLAALVALTAHNDLAAATLWQGIVYPALLFGLPALAGAVVMEWRDADEGMVARLRDRIEAAPRGWGDAPALIARGAAVVVVGLIGLGALMTAIALFARGGEVIALFEAAHTDALGATALTLGQLAYLPTVVVWAISFIVGPGFALGTGTSVAPAGTQAGVLPGIPVLGIVPASTTPWLLLLALLPVALGAFAGWIARSRLVVHAASATSTPVAPVPDASADVTRTAALAGLIAAAEADREPAGEPAPPRDEPEHDPIGARLGVTAGIAIVAAAATAVLCLLASGSLGPGALSQVGPQAGPVALTVGIEVAVGAGILLLSPRKRSALDTGTPTSAPTDGPADAEPREAVEGAPVD